jgi:hypothetical protein
MCASLDGKPPELAAVVTALSIRKGVFHLKGRLLKSARIELSAARNSGLTWRVIWQALREEGYPGGYQQFCKAANRVTESGRVPACTKNKNLPPPVAKKEVLQARVKEREHETSNKEKPAWQIQREETMTRLDREAELNRQREAQWQPKKVFKMTPFVGRGEI